MKPNLALLLASDRVSLVQRAEAGWAPVGSVALDQPNGEAALAQLRERAHALPGDHSCKLVIPNDQIKYLTLEGNGDPDAAVRAALDGATPYAVDDLEYDWTADNGVIHVAAVALETLAEAEDFAVQHGFEPVCFAAIPGSAVFRGEPFFGVTKWAVDSLPDRTHIKRDTAPIRVTGDAPRFEAAAKAAPAADPNSVAPAAVRAVAEAGPAPKADADAAPGTVEKPAVEAPAKTADAGPSATDPIRADRSPKASAAGGASIAAPPPSLQQPSPQQPSKPPAISAAPPLPSPADEGLGDPARLDELAANLRPDPDARLDRSLSAEATASPAKPAASTPRKAERQRLTPFSQRKGELRGKPRFLGLILTALLLLLLVGVAAWASAFLDDGLARFFGRGDDFKLANVPITESAADHAAPILLDDAQNQRPAILPLPQNAAPTRQVTALPDRPTPLSPSEAMARYAATGIWQMAPAPPDAPAAGAPLHDFRQVSLDHSVVFAAPARLPRRTADARDKMPDSPAEPPPAGTRFDFDERGLVIASADGTLTPEGIRVFARRPAQTPPANMAQTATGSAKANPEQIEEIAPEAPQGQSLTNEPSLANPALANVRPRARPSNLLPEGAAAQTPNDAPQGDNPGSATASAAAFVSDPALAALRPRIRPAAISAIAASLESASGATSAPLGSAAAVISEPELLDDDAFEDATEQAVSASLAPLRRPSDFETIIDRTRAGAAAQPTTKQQPAAPAPAAPKMQPSLPSSASVSNQATDKSVLNLRQVNLIGVYGTTASRRALVRLGNGRFQKVSVGDNLDGGQVAAIGESELHYVKRGRKLVLEMPPS